MKDFNLSYSLVSKFAEYKQEKFCGLLFDALYISKTAKLEFPDPNHPINVGRYFEYLCTGYGENEIIQPKRNKDGSLPASYRAIQAQKENFNKFLAKFTDEDEDITVGSVLEVEVNGYNIKCIADIITSKYIIDLKASGTLDSRFNDGWGQEEEWLAKSPKMLQAKFNVYLVWKSSGLILPFIFAVFSTKNENDFKLIKVDISESTLYGFEEELRLTGQMIDFENEVGYTAYPTLEACRECPLHDTCTEMIEVPNTINITL